MMMYTSCDMAGCRQDGQGQKVTVKIGGIDKELETCAWHLEMFQTMDPATYDLGLNYIQEVELRIHPAKPAEPVEPTAPSIPTE